MQNAGIVPCKFWAARVVVPHDDVAANRHEQGEGHVGGGAVYEAGGVAHGDAPFLGGVQVDVIDAHAEVADDAQVGHAVHFNRADVGMAVGDKPFGFGKQRRVGLHSLPDDDAAGVADHLHHLRRQLRLGEDEVGHGELHRFTILD